MLSRRRWCSFAAASLVPSSLLGLPPHAAGQEKAPGKPVPWRVAAIQFDPVLGDVDANLRRVDEGVREALGKGAKIVVLPEFFTSGAGLHPSVFQAYRPVDGRPTQLLQDLAKMGDAIVCGSFLATSGRDAFNTMVVALPSGQVMTHDKDFPTMMFESAVYAGGEDEAYAAKLIADGARSAAERIPSRANNSRDGIVSHGDMAVGAAICWELVRYRTAKRLTGKVDVLLASSAWWTSDPEQPWPGQRREQAQQGWREHQALIDAAPRRMARVLGAPVVHANFAGTSDGFNSIALDKPARGRYLGHSQIVDATGKTVAHMGLQPGILVADVLVGKVVPSETPTEDFWMPEVSEGMRSRWATSGAAGRDHYLMETRARFGR